MTLTIFLLILLPVAMLLALASVIFGLFKTAGGQNQQRNKWMRFRILFQAVALAVFFALFFLVKSN